ncbi:mannose-6-phosphate isomerase, class I [Bifidobacterium choloepi]|uniref:mannose-6-phosphate isomerase n=1 Tax=Bifidobacterium choloepi TaxID=2614131 RepID=A0A6I5N1S6_9BIFI|nr:mannose-6-phosphate isomerase, class I [Bifidobacterium choloepi]
MYPIHPVPKRYAWGSHERLQRMFHLDGDQWHGPLAEMWFSGHAQSPSPIEIPGHAPTTVPEAIVRQPEHMIGRRGSDQFGPVLPFLFKIISADEPLSLQVHPVDFQARAGFNEENAAGIALDSPLRSFKDTNAKSEMVVALEPFTAAVGFAGRSFAVKNLSLVDHPVARRMVEALNSTKDDSAAFAEAERMMPVSASVWSPTRRRVFRAFHAAVTADQCHYPEPHPPLADALRAARAKATHVRQEMAFDFAITAEESFHDDLSVLALLMMNPLRLEEGESVFIPTGSPHAYIHGTGAEIMTNSDNVLRAGMTVKHKDIPHLLQCLDCRPATPIDPSDVRIGTLLMRDMVFYKPGVSEYMLAYGHVDADHEPWPVMNSLAMRYDKLVQQVSGRVLLPHLGPRVVLCTQGAVNCVTEREQRVLTQGEAVFVPAADGWSTVDPVTDGSAAAHGSFVIASTPF